VVFKYVNRKRENVTCDDEDGFDIFCSDAEGFGCRANVRIINAVFNVSDFIKDAPKLKPLRARDNMDDKAEFVGIHSGGGRGFMSAKGGGEVALDAGKEGEDEGEVVKRKKGVFARLEDAPYPVTHMVMLGGKNS
jgi:hypothetical protein